MSTTVSILRTLRRLPDDVVLDIAGREIDPVNFRTCVCGWALRGGLAMAAGVDPSEVEIGGVVTYELLRIFGGSHKEWLAIFDGICDYDEDTRDTDHKSEYARIERAFVTRLNEVDLAAVP